jgi:hypothetical protein
MRARLQIGEKTYRVNQHIGFAVQTWARYSVWALLLLCCLFSGLSLRSYLKLSALKSEMQKIGSSIESPSMNSSSIPVAGDTDE